jgi:hypothetical protein
MLLKAVVISIGTFALANTAYSQDVEKNGQPCVTEICIGDGLAELQKIEWDRVKNPFSDKNKPLYHQQEKSLT